MGDQERQHRAICVKERLHVDYQVLQQGQSFDRFDGDFVGEISHENLAGQTIEAIDAHRV
jgi:hypothetical protein